MQAIDQSSYREDVVTTRFFGLRASIRRTFNVNFGVFNRDVNVNHPSHGHLLRGPFLYRFWGRFLRGYDVEGSHFRVKKDGFSHGRVCRFTLRYFCELNDGRLRLNFHVLFRLNNLLFDLYRGALYFYFYLDRGDLFLDVYVNGSSPYFFITFLCAFFMSFINRFLGLYVRFCVFFWIIPAWMLGTCGIVLFFRLTFDLSWGFTVVRFFAPLIDQSNHRLLIVSGEWGALFTGLFRI